MQTTTYQTVKLTKFSHGAGCGCKISPKILDQILNNSGQTTVQFSNLIVGNSDKDDAAVFDLGDGTAIISTTDFFMPIVDDAIEFGKIASANAISDIYAMGGQPLMAIAILGWPIDKIPAEIAGKVLEGARIICESIGIPLAGGHSIDCPEPIFGLAVTGRIELVDLKKNGGDIKDCLLYLTKPIGVGILTTAEKQGKLRIEDQGLASSSMMKLNTIGQVCGKLPYVKAMTDVTGFGLLGHLVEMCESSDMSAEISFEKIPLLNQAAIGHYIDEKCIPGGTTRNFDSYGHKISTMTERQRAVLCDPQTSGGLMIAVQSEYSQEFERIMQQNNFNLEPIGKICPKDTVTIIVK